MQSLRQNGTGRILGMSVNCHNSRRPPFPAWTSRAQPHLQPALVHGIPAAQPTPAAGCLPLLVTLHHLHNGCLLRGRRARDHHPAAVRRQHCQLVCHCRILQHHGQAGPINRQLGALPLGRDCCDHIHGGLLLAIAQLQGGSAAERGLKGCNAGWCCKHTRDCSHAS